MEEDFESDGCTGWFDFDYTSCCAKHDLDYHNGIDRMAADVDLFECVSTFGYPIMAVLMFLGVRFFGPFYLFFKRNLIKSRDKGKIN